MNPFDERPRRSIDVSTESSHRRLSLGEYASGDLLRSADTAHTIEACMEALINGRHR